MPVNKSTEKINNKTGSSTSKKKYYDAPKSEKWLFNVSSVESKEKEQKENNSLTVHARLHFEISGE